MLLAKRFTFLLFCFFIIFLIAFWGLKNNFPGNSLSRIAQLYLNKQTGLIFEIKDLELGWEKISTPGIFIYKPVSLPNKKNRLLLFIEGIESPFSSFFLGKFIINGKVHGGIIKLSLDIFSQNNLEISLEDVKLEKVPSKDLVPYASVSGDLSLFYKIKTIDNLKQLNIWPHKGYIKGSIKNSEIIFIENSNLFDFQFPELKFSEIFFDIEISHLISIEMIELKGSLDGVINGKIQPNINHPKMSLLDLNLKIVPSSRILEKFQIFTPMLSPLQCGKTINVNIKGTMNRINFPSRNKC